MKIIDARKMTALEIAQMMKKTAFDECTLSPRVQAGVTAMFGEPLTAAQVVDRIVADVRMGGDEKLLYYTSLLDKADLATFSLQVTEEEFAAAQAVVKPLT